MRPLLLVRLLQQLCQPIRADLFEITVASILRSRDVHHCPKRWCFVKQCSSLQKQE